MLSSKDLLMIENDIRGMIRHFVGARRDLENDIYQQVFMKLLEIEREEGSLDRLGIDGQINKSYVYSVVQACFVNHIRKENRPPPKAVYYVTSQKCAEYKEKLLSLIMRRIPKLHWMQREIIELLLQGHSYRSLEQQTGICHQIFYNAVKDAKNKIRTDKEVSQAYRDWKAECSRVSERSY